MFFASGEKLRFRLTQDTFGISSSFRIYLWLPVSEQDTDSHKLTSNNVQICYPFLRPSCAWHPGHCKFADWQTTRDFCRSNYLNISVIVNLSGCVILVCISVRRQDIKISNKCWFQCPVYSLLSSLSLRISSAVILPAPTLALTNDYTIVFKRSESNTSKDQ
jgi:hypothetical protein